LSTLMPDQCGYSRSMFMECAADGVFTSLPIKFIIKTIQWYRYEKVYYIY
jgi:hypothetical protein